MERKTVFVEAGVKIHTYIYTRRHASNMIFLCCYKLLLSPPSKYVWSKRRSTTDAPLTWDAWTLHNWGPCTCPKNCGSVQGAIHKLGYHFLVEFCMYPDYSWNKQFNVHELFGFLWCSTCSKLDSGPKCDVRKVRCSDIQCSECSKFGILMFVPRLILVY